MVNLAWLGQEAKLLHDIFGGLFYAIVTSLLLVGILVEYFKWPLGGVPAFGVLVGRALVAAILLHTYPDVTNLLATLSDDLAARLGDLNEFKVVLSKMGDKLGEMSASWVSVKETTTVVLSFLGFFVLYFSVYVAEGIHLFAWTLCYVFSPILIALFVLPATSGAAKALYRSLFEVSCWKIVWSTLATLLWSMSISSINQPGQDVNFVSVICLNLMLASSLIATPFIVHALATSGLSGFTQTLGAIAVGSVTVSPGKIAGHTKAAARSGTQRLKSFAQGSSKDKVAHNKEP